MQLADLLTETLDVDGLEAWENERTPTHVRVFGVRLHSLGLSVPETIAVLGWLGIDRSHGAVWAWTHRLADRQPYPPPAKPARVTVDETAIRVNGDWRWLYAAIDVDSKLVLGADVFGRRGTDPAAAFLHGFIERYDIDETEFPVDDFGYLTVFSRLDLSGQLDKHDRNHVEKWFQALKTRTGRFHTSWVGSRASSRRWIDRFVHHYNQNRPNQALNHHTPTEEVLN